MKEITATSYNIKFCLKVFLRSILFSIISSIIIGIISNFIKIQVLLDVLQSLLIIYGIKFIYIDGMKKLNSKYSLSPSEFNTFPQKFSSVLIFLAIFSFIFSTLFSSLYVILKLIATLFMSSLIPAGFNFFEDAHVIVWILNIIKNVIYSLLVIMLLKENLSNIFNNLNLSIPRKILILMIVFLVLSLTTSIITNVNSSSNEISTSDSTSQNNEDNENTVDSDNSDGSNNSNGSAKDNFGALLSLGNGDSFTIFNENSLYHASFFEKTLCEFDNLEFKNKKILLNESDLDINISLNDIDILYKTDEKLYFYADSTEQYSYSNGEETTTTSDSGLFALNFESSEIEKKADEFLDYNLSRKTSNYLDYIVKTDDNTYSLKKFDYEKESTKIILSAQLSNPDSDTFDVEFYDNKYITYVCSNNKSTIYLDSNPICVIEMPLDEFFVCNNYVHLLVNNMVYSVNLETLQIDNASETPFSTSDYHEKFFYDSTLISDNKIIYYDTNFYEFNSETFQFNILNIDSSTENGISTSTKKIYNLSDEYLLTLDDSLFIEPYIVKKDTYETIKKFDNLQELKIDLNGNFYFVFDDDSIKKFSEKLLEE